MAVHTSNVLPHVHVDRVFERLLALRGCLRELCPDIAVAPPSLEGAGMAAERPAAAITGQRLRFLGERVGTEGRIIRVPLPGAVVAIETPHMALVAGPLYIVSGLPGDGRR